MWVLQSEMRQHGPVGMGLPSAEEQSQSRQRENDAEIALEIPLV